MSMPVIMKTPDRDPMFVEVIQFCIYILHHLLTTPSHRHCCKTGFVSNDKVCTGFCRLFDHFQRRKHGGDDTRYFLIHATRAQLVDRIGKGALGISLSMISITCFTVSAVAADRSPALLIPGNWRWQLLPLPCQLWKGTLSFGTFPHAWIWDQDIIAFNSESEPDKITGCSACSCSAVWLPDNIATVATPAFFPPEYLL